MNLQDILLNPQTEIISRNPWGSVKTALSKKDANIWIDEMLKSGLIDQNQAAALKLDAMQSQNPEPMQKLSEDPKFLNKVFGK